MYRTFVILRHTFKEAAVQPIYSLLIVIRIVFSWVLDYSNAVLRFLIRLTDPILEPFRRIMNDPRFAAVPKVLETPKGDDPVRADLENLGVLRGFRAG